MPKLPLQKLVMLLLAGACFASSCKKYKDEPGISDPRLSRKYCNDPEAVNYNYDFPGTADNSVCYYPSDVFKGNYSFVDSVFNGNNTLLSQTSLNLTFAASDKKKLLVSGFCSSDQLKFTANRQRRANADTTILNGQRMCRDKDTLSGYITASAADTTRLRFFLTVVSDTGVTYHQGTAYRQ